MKALILLLFCFSSARSQSLLLFGSTIWNPEKGSYYRLPTGMPFARLAGYYYSNARLVCTWETEGRLETVSVMLPDSIKVPRREARLSPARQASLNYPVYFYFTEHTLRLGQTMALMKGDRPVWGDTADGRPLGSFPVYGYSDPVLSPDAKSIAVVYLSTAKAKSLRSDHYNLLEVDVANGSRTMITKDGQSPSYSPDGHYLLYTDRQGVRRIYDRKKQRTLQIHEAPAVRDAYWLEQ